jgi:hypothetical protein
VPDGSDDHLKLCAAAGFGTFEHWDASRQYHTIDYRRIEIDDSEQQRIYLPQINLNT